MEVRNTKKVGTVCEMSWGIYFRHSLVLYKGQGCGNQIWYGMVWCIRHMSQDHSIEARWLAMCRAAVVGLSPPLKRAVQRAVTVHNDETEPLVVLKQLVQRLPFNKESQVSAGNNTFRAAGATTRNPQQKRASATTSLSSACCLPGVPRLARPHPTKELLLTTLSAARQSRVHLGVELVVTQVERRVDGLERLEVEVHPLLLALIGHDSPAVDHQPVGGYSGIEPAAQAHNIQHDFWAKNDHKENTTQPPNVHKCPWSTGQCAESGWTTPASLWEPKHNVAKLDSGAQETPWGM